MDYVTLRAYRVHLREVTGEEKRQHFGPGYDTCVLECPKDHPEAVPGWRVEDAA